MGCSMTDEEGIAIVALFAFFDGEVSRGKESAFNRDDRRERRAPRSLVGKADPQPASSKRRTEN